MKTKPLAAHTTAVAMLAFAAIAIADTSRTPDASAASAAVSVNTTTGDSMVSQPGSVDTKPRGMVLTIL